MISYINKKIKKKCLQTIKLKFYYIAAHSLINYYFYNLLTGRIGSAHGAVSVDQLFIFLFFWVTVIRACADSNSAPF